jgi:DNA repair protein RadD
VQVILRGYQQEAVEAIYTWFSRVSGNPLLVLPTAAGKSVVQAEFVRRALSEWPDQRIILVSHVKELLAQNTAKLLEQWPGAPISIYSAGMKRFERGTAIQVAGIQSVYRKSTQLGKFDLIIVDECHLIPHAGDGMYRQFFEEQHMLNPNVKIIGMTATPYRLNGGLLYQGAGKLFDGIAYEVPMNRLIEEGFLCNLISKIAVTQPDLTGVGVRGGDYIPDQLAEVMDDAELIRQAVDETVALCQGRKSWLLFCTSVKHAQHVAAEIASRGIISACIHGETPSYERFNILSDFKAGKIQALTNCNVLTTGFDAPNIDALGLMRPTKSTGLYVQMVGRGMRLSPGKPDCLVLDFGRNIERHGPVNDVKKPKPKVGGGGEPYKVCPECGWEVNIAVMICPACLYEWPKKEIPKHETKASFADILRRKMESQNMEIAVDRVEYRRHNKFNDDTSPPTLCVTYYSGINVKYSEWVCFEHDGYARTKAVAWWAERDKLGLRPFAPSNVDTACDLLNDPELKGQFREPSSIWVNVGGKYPVITKFNFQESLV